MIDASDKMTRLMTRRGFVIAGGAAAAMIAFRLRYEVESVAAKNSAPKDVKIVKFSDGGQRQDVATLPLVVKTEAEWRQQLSPIAFEVTRHAGTERAYSGEYWNLHDKGLYRCICCDTALFSSDTKFESGTGWPSFWQPIAKENVHEGGDLSLGMMRTAVSCRLCEAHLGHVFDDGPKPTGLRYCMNSVALRFVKSA
ncbi:peptide-methionine (R)-S-oxide reductase MsrB [Acidicapsa dinghuensis]|uniref:Peptide methionine sulfoxide reductase MsrB n=1 Tax=Acidicapsa dinghuensis TaxID=2218256 RepID=A0ABW1EI97_9BACT|nr:peptide-methionine (R)-S-oxide reductase MsrB [Acidicapsa dinghuensis]